MKTPIALALAFLTIPAVAIDAYATCKKGQVLVKQKTALRRGPGLNYQPTTMIDEGKCWKALERSSDDQWVMIEGGKDLIGWVPASMLAEDDRAELAKGDKKQTGPIGSGQERGFIIARTAAALLARPDVNAESKRTLAAGSKLLALSITTDGSLVEVRDERGDTGWVAARGISDEGAVLPSLPRLNEGLNGGGAMSEKSSKETPAPADKAGKADKADKADKGRKSDKSDKPGDTPKEHKESKSDRPRETNDPRKDNSDRVVPKDEDPSLSANANGSGGTSGSADVSIELDAMMALPSHALASNGAAGIRRYTINSVATGAHLEAKALSLQPVRLRIAYDFTLLTGLEQIGAPGKAVGGQQHDARLLVGYPIAMDIVTLIPELGYSFALFAMDPALPGSTDIQFVSNQTHSASLGGVVSFAFTEDFSLDVEVNGTLGTTIETPIDLGGAGLAFGARVGAGIAYQLGGGAGLVARYQLVHRSAPFSGSSITDPSITEATIKHTENNFGVGLSFAL